MYLLLDHARHGLRNLTILPLAFGCLTSLIAVVERWRIWQLAHKSVACTTIMALILAGCDTGERYAPCQMMLARCQLLYGATDRAGHCCDRSSSWHFAADEHNCPYCQARSVHVPAVHELRRLTTWLMPGMQIRLRTDQIQKSMWRAEESCPSLDKSSISRWEACGEHDNALLRFALLKAFHGIWVYICKRQGKLCDRIAQ